MIVEEAAPAYWSRPLRLIHLSLAIAVTVQLFIGSFMRGPHPSRPDGVGFEAHEILGATILAIIILHWLWSCTHPDEGLRHLFPWTRAGLRNVLAQLSAGVRERCLPRGGPDGGVGGLAGFIHGLGLLAVTVMVLVGSAFFLLRLAGASQDSLGIAEDVHDVFAVVVWIYWGGHLLATVLHSFVGESIWRRMFSVHA